MKVLPFIVFHDQDYRKTFVFLILAHITHSAFLHRAVGFFMYEMRSVINVVYFMRGSQEST